MIINWTSFTIGATISAIIIGLIAGIQSRYYQDIIKLMIEKEFEDENGK